MKKKILCLAVMLMLLCQPAFAQKVIVDGAGDDLTGAMKDASRNAVERVVGTLVDSTTLVDNGRVQIDRIYMKSQGFIKDIDILSKEKRDGLMYIHACVDVDTDPDAELMDNLKMVMMLNDPRIAVVALRQETSDNTVGHDMVTETAMNDKLLKLGFTHIADTASMYETSDINMLGQIFDGQADARLAARLIGADYLVLGRARTESHVISLPDGHGGYQPTLLSTGNAILTVRIIRLDTGEVAAVFTTNSRGVGNSGVMAERKALINASVDVAEKIEQKFRHLSASVDVVR